MRVIDSTTTGSSRRQSWLQRAFLGSLVLGLTLAGLCCASSSAPRRAHTGYAPIDEMLGAQEDFDAAIGASDIDGAEEALAVFDEKVKKASMQTIIHPGYARVQDGLTRSRRALRQERWAIAAQKSLGETLEDVREIHGGNGNGSDLATRKTNQARSVEAFGKCLKITKKLARHRDYPPQRQIDTALGKLTLGGVTEACKTGRRDAKQTIVGLEWQQQVQEVADRVTDAMKALDGAKAQDKVAAAESALVALETCNEDLFETETFPGFDKRQRFKTYWAKLPATNLRQACANDFTRVDEEKGTYSWRAAIEDVVSRIEAAKRSVDQAMAKRQPSERIELLASALEVYRWCVGRVHQIDARKQKEWLEANPTRSDARRVKRLRKRCRQDESGVTKLLAKARAKASK